MAGSTGETSQAEAKCNAAGNEQAGIVASQTVHLAHQLIDALAAQVIGQVDHALRHVGDVMGKASAILVFKFCRCCLGTLRNLFQLIGGRTAVAVQLSLALVLHLLAGFARLCLEFLGTRSGSGAACLRGACLACLAGGLSGSAR